MGTTYDHTSLASERDRRLHAAAFYISHSVIGLIAIVFLGYLLPACRPYAYTDEWTYRTPLQATSVAQFLSWAFAQHVDHRIPLQKISNYFVLRLAGFDFRYVVGFNFILACSLTLMLLYVARKYRGYQSLGDVIIPLTTLNFAAGFSLWGFHFQFLSSIFFAVCFVTACVAFADTGQQPWLNIAVVSLILCALCGLNGLIVSSVLTLILLTWLLWRQRTENSTGQMATYSLLLLSVLLNLSVWIAWRPSAAARTSHSLPTLAYFLYGLLGSCFGVYSLTGTWWKFGFVLVLLALACCELLRRGIVGRLSLADLAIMAALAASLAVLTAISVGRSALQGGWSPVLAFHYGYWSILIPLLSWVVVSARMPLRWNVFASLAVATIFGLSFQVNEKWRLDYKMQAEFRQRTVLMALRSPMSAAELADNYILDFYYVSTPDTKRQVSEGIDAFRMVGAATYGKPFVGKAAKQVVALPPSVAQLGAGACRVSQLVGFQDVENWGVWSREDPATIKLESSVRGPLNVNLTAYAMNYDAPHVVNVTMGQETMSISLTADIPRTFRLQYVLPQPVNEIVVSGIKPISPKDAGLGLDERKLAVGVVHVECIPEGKAVNQ